MIIGCLTAIAWCHLDVTGTKTSTTFMDMSFGSSERSGPCKDGYIYIPVACVIMLYLVYLVECWHSHIRLELKYKCDIATVYSTINKMQAALPVVWWKATCYHYVRRTRQVMRYRNGDAFTSTQVYYDRVDSSTAGAAFNFTQCGVKDISRPVSDLEMYPAVKIKVSKGFSFANVDTECQFEEQRSQFFQEYETKDDYMEGREGMDLMNVDFKEYMIAFKDPHNLPWYVSDVVFWLASVFLLSWPLRTITELKTAHLHYHVHKLFGSNYLEGEDYSGLMSRVSTMNSDEFEMSIRNNNVIVPSYSEAVLADAQEQIQQKHYGTIKRYPSKFPRSLTNVTLAARSSSAARRSVTPTVTMNHVKKFKSCSAFGVSELSETAINSNSIRYHIQQLLRDRSRLQRKRTNISQFSISGLSLGNGSVRFNIGTPGTPDDYIMAPSFSCHSMASSKTNETLSEGVAIRDETTRFEGLRTQNQRVQNTSNFRPSRLDIHQTEHVAAINRPDSVLESGGREHDNLNYAPSMSKNGSTEASPSDALFQGQPGSYNLPPLFPVTDCANAVSGATIATTTPTTPSSPPGYDEAIRMRRIAASLVAKVHLTSVKPASEIELTRNSRVMRTHREFPVTESRNLRDEKQNRDSVLNVLPVEVGIDRIQSFDPSSSSGNRSDILSLETFRLSSEREPAEEQHYYSHYCQNHYSHQNSHHTQQKIIKMLPKVSNSICPDSEESDLECLHNTSSEHKNLGNEPIADDYLSSGISQSGLVRDRSISNSVATLADQDGANNPFYEHSTFLYNRHSTASSAAAVLVPSSHASPSPSRRRETSV